MTFANQAIQTEGWSRTTARLQTAESLNRMRPLAGIIRDAVRHVLADEVIDDRGMHLAFISETRNRAVDPGYDAERRVDTADAQSDPVARLGKACMAAYLAATFRDVDQIAGKTNRVHPPMNRQAEGAPVTGAGDCVQAHAFPLARVGK
jgi:hypothetical protein